MGLRDLEGMLELLCIFFSERGRLTSEYNDELGFNIRFLLLL